MRFVAFTDSLQVGATIGIWAAIDRATDAGRTEQLPGC